MPSNRGCEGRWMNAPRVRFWRVEAYVGAWRGEAHGVWKGEGVTRMEQRFEAGPVTYAKREHKVQD
jgi:hypothetical protein